MPGAVSRGGTIHHLFFVCLLAQEMWRLSGFPSSRVLNPSMHAPRRQNEVHRNIQMNDWLGKHVLLLWTQ